MNRLDIRAWIFILFLILGLAGVNWMGSPIYLDVNLQGVFDQDTLQVGPQGPIRFQFSRAVQQDHLAPLISITPPITGKYTWNDATHVDFIPDQPILRDTVYTIRLNPGVLGRSGEKIKTLKTWKMALRSPMVIYLSAQAFASGELWIYDLSGIQPPQQITQTHGNILDYAPAPNGEKVIYSVFNTKNGMDLWIIDRDGKENHILLDCGADRCSSISWASDSNQIAYTRQSAGLTADAPLGAPRPWLMDTKTGETRPLFDDPQMIGFGPSWSPDGKKIASFDGVQGGIRIYDLGSKQSVFLPTLSGIVGTWSLDSQTMVYTDMSGGGEDTRILVYQADTTSGQSHQIFTSNDLATNFYYDIPLISPKGDWLAVGVQPSSQTPGHQIWLVSAQEDQVERITHSTGVVDDEYSWNSIGDKLLFRRLELKAGSSSETIIWDSATNQEQLVANNSTMPAWLP